MDSNEIVVVITIVNKHLLSCHTVVAKIDKIFPDDFLVENVWI